MANEVMRPSATSGTWSTLLTSLSLLLCVVCLPALSVDQQGGLADSVKSRADMSLWIDNKQVRQFFNGFQMDIYAISEGMVLPYVLDPNFDKHLPVVPSEVTSVNFTWTSGESRNYYYDFNELESFDAGVLHHPVISIDQSGLVPKKPTVFQVFIPCVGNSTGIATFRIGLKIINMDTSQNLAGTPIRLTLQKQCTYHGPDPECDKKCGNGKCNQDKICVCPAGFLGKYCESALCYPQCMNGGTCVTPGVCLCPSGFQGLYCEVCGSAFCLHTKRIHLQGGICNQKCLNGGKCVQKDMCSCRRGYYGARCEYSKCLIPCLNGGKCIGVNRCRCKRGFAGSQCQTRNPNSKCHKCNRNQRKKSRRKFV